MSTGLKGDAGSKIVTVAALSPYAEPKALSWALEKFGWEEGHWVQERARILSRWLAAADAKANDSLKSDAHNKAVTMAVLSPNAKPKPLSWALEHYGWGTGHWVRERGRVKMRWLTFVDAGPGNGLTGTAGTVWSTLANATTKEYEPYDVNDYLKLVPWQHRRPKFLALLRSILSGLVDEMNFTYNMGRRFDLDSAIGGQLNQIGEWAGLIRNVVESFNETGIYPIPDSIYRNLIKVKIASNRWDGTVPGAYEAWESVFRRQSLIAIEDHQDMSITMYVTGIDGSGVFKDVIKRGLVTFKPAGVRVRYFFTDPASSKFFAWGVENDMYAGWGRGHWASVA